MKQIPFIAYSEITEEIYIICGKDKWRVTEQVIKAMKATGRLPNKQPERPQGRWIIDEEWDFNYESCHNLYTCSNCKNVELNKFNYCPHCGCQMGVSENES